MEALFKQFMDIRSIYKSKLQSLNHKHPKSDLE